MEYCNRINNDKLYFVQFERCSNENSKKNLVSLTRYPKNPLSVFPSINLIILRLFMCTQSPNPTKSTINRSKFPLAPNNNPKLHLQGKAVIQTQEGHSVVLPPKTRKYTTTPHQIKYFSTSVKLPYVPYLDIRFNLLDHFREAHLSPICHCQSGQPNSGQLRAPHVKRTKVFLQLGKLSPPESFFFLPLFANIRGETLRPT